MKSKAVGLRLPSPLWEKITQYGCENHPKPDNKPEEKDFEISATLIDLIEKGLGIENVEQPVKQDVKHLVEEIVKQNAEKLFNDKKQDKEIEKKINTAIAPLSEKINQLEESIETIKK